MSVASSFKELISSEKPVIIDFFAEWCGPCKAFALTLKRLKKELGDDIRVVKIDIDRNHTLTRKLGIRSVPTLHIYKSGELKWSATGLQPLHTLKEQIAQIS